MRKGGESARNEVAGFIEPSYLVGVGVLLVGAYVVFMKKYYHLHEEYLESLKK